MFDRWCAVELKASLERPFVHLVFGAFQTGKTTLLNALLPPETVRVDFANPAERSQHLADPGLFLKLCQEMPKDREGQCVFVDEAQSVPSVVDCGPASLRQRQAALVIRTVRQFGAEAAEDRSESAPRPLLLPPASPVDDGRASTGTETDRVCGVTSAAGMEGGDGADESLSGVGVGRAAGLRGLAWRGGRGRNGSGADAHRLSLGAFGGGNPPGGAGEGLGGFCSVPGTSRVGVGADPQLRWDRPGDGSFSADRQVALPVVGGHVHRLARAGVLGSKRKNQLSTPKFLLFDLGVRHAAAELRASREIVQVNPGAFFEQWVGIELWKRLQYLGEGRLHYLRTRDGMEIDYVAEHRGALTPIEVKWSERPTVQDARHLLTFLQEHPKQAKHGYIVCRCSAPLRIHDLITALPWFCLRTRTSHKEAQEAQKGKFSFWVACAFLWPFLSHDRPRCHPPIAQPGQGEHPGGWRHRDGRQFRRGRAAPTEDRASVWAAAARVRDDTAFQDRIHCYAPGWDVPKVSAQLFTNHFGAFAEALRTSQPYTTRLDPPPADPKCRQPPNAEAISSTNHRTETH